MADWGWGDCVKAPPTHTVPVICRWNKIEASLNTDPAVFCDKSQPREKGAVEKERGLFKCQPPEMKGVLLSQSPCSHQCRQGFLSGAREKAEQRRQGEGAVDAQAVFLLLPLWIFNVSPCLVFKLPQAQAGPRTCLLYTSDAADDIGQV